MDVDLKDKNNLITQNLRKQFLETEAWLSDPQNTDSESIENTESSFVNCPSIEQISVDYIPIESTQIVLIDAMKPQPKKSKKTLGSLITRIVRSTCNFFKKPRQ